MPICYTISDVKRQPAVHDFDRLAPYYDRALKFLLFFLGTERALRKSIASFIDCESLTKGAKILEVGCGTGANLKAIDDLWPGKYKLFGVDLSEPMLSEAKKKPFVSSTTFTHANSALLPFEDETFNVVPQFYSCMNYSIRKD